MRNYRFVIGIAGLALSAGAIGLGGCSSGSNGTGAGGSTGGAATGGAANAAGQAGVTGSGGTSGHAAATGGAGPTGAAGMLGSAGTGGPAGTTGTGGASAAPFFTDDFESDTAGQQPAGFDNLINYNYKTTNPQADGSGSAVVDNMHTHNGSKLAVHFSAQGGNLMTFLERPLPTGTNHLYVRAYFYLASSIGDEPASSGDNHETLLGLTTDPTSASSQIRFGQIKGAIGTNESVSDNIAPVSADWNMGALISASAWHCLEVEFDGTAAYNSLYAYSDGILVHSITSAADWAHSPGQAADWMKGYFTDVMFGWQSFSQIKNDVWMDDLAMSTTGRLGCN
jgi:polysaccharide lyase-like protein